MTSKQYQVGNNLVQVQFDTLFEDFIATLDQQSFIIVTDETVMQYHGHRFKQHRCVSLPPGESYKKQSTVDNIIDQLLQFEADKQTMLVAVGGGGAALGARLRRPRSRRRRR